MIEKISDTNGYLKIAAFDHRDSLEKIISKEYMESFKTLLSDAFKEYISAILVDPVFGLNAIDIAVNNNVGVLLTREQSGYTDTDQGRTTVLSEYTSQSLKDLGASAIKILLYFNPDAHNSGEQLSILAKVKEEADAIGLPLLVEPITYPVPYKNYVKHEAIIETIRQLKPYTDVFKIEFPIDVTYTNMNTANQYLDMINDVSGDTPWILLSRGMDYPLFRDAVGLSKSYGSKGYAVGRSVWKEIDQLKSWEDIYNFIHTTGKTRMKELADIYSM